MSEDCAIEDETARTVLTATSVEPTSATALSERCGVSEPTVYWQLEDLRTCDLPEARTKPVATTPRCPGRDWNGWQ